MASSDQALSSAEMVAPIASVYTGLCSGAVSGAPWAGAIPGPSSLRLGATSNIVGKDSLSQPERVNPASGRAPASQARSHAV